LKNIKKRIKKLYEYPMIYDNILDGPPKGIPAREKMSRVINIDFSKKD